MAQLTLQSHEIVKTDTTPRFNLVFSGDGDTLKKLGETAGKTIGVQVTEQSSGITVSINSDNATYAIEKIQGAFPNEPTIQSLNFTFTQDYRQFSKLGSGRPRQI